MSCIYCDDGVPWSTTVIKRHNLTFHERSERHKMNGIKFVNQSAKAEESQAEKALSQLYSEAFDQMALLFRNAHALARAAQPYTDFYWQCQLSVICKQW